MKKLRDKYVTPAALVVSAPVASVLAARPELRDVVEDYVLSSDAANTIRARRADWKVFSEWCTANKVQAMPASVETVASFLADQSHGVPGRAPKAVATVVRYARSIHAIHAFRGHTSPTSDMQVRTVLRGIRRDRGVRQDQKEALTAEMIAEVLAAYEKTKAYSPSTILRDRTILLLGLATAMRRGELCALDIENLHHVDGGIVIDLRKSKTDQEMKGRPIAVQQLDEEFATFCPVRAVNAWVEFLERTSGPLFVALRRNGQPKITRLGDRQVSIIVKAAVEAGGFDPELFGGHSLRAGFVTTARRNNVDWASIMEQTGHRRLETAKLYTRYTPDVFVATRVADIFRNAFRKKG